MAHLTRCWCGRRYRCEIDHSVRAYTLSSIRQDDCGACPDDVIHGPRFVPGKRVIEFTAIQTPAIKGAAFPIVQMFPKKESE